MLRRKGGLYSGNGETNQRGRPLWLGEDLDGSAHTVPVERSGHFCAR